jgi:hypothetical protein
MEPKEMPSHRDARQRTLKSKIKQYYLLVRAAVEYRAENKGQRGKKQN